MNSKQRNSQLAFIPVHVLINSSDWNISICRYTVSQNYWGKSDIAPHSLLVFRDVQMMPKEDTVLFFVEPNKMLTYFIVRPYGKTMLLKYNRSTFYGCNLKL